MPFPSNTDTEETAKKSFLHSGKIWRIDAMSNSTEQTLDDEPRPSNRSPNNQLREDQQAQEWETLARAWVSAFPEAKAVNVSQVEVWIDSNFCSLPSELQSMPRSELIDRLLSIQNYLRFPSHSQV